MRWLCGCLGQTGAEAPAHKPADVAGSDAALCQTHVVGKLAMQAELLRSAEEHNSDVQDKDQGDASALLQPRSTPQRPQRPTQQLVTWSPGQVSLDLNGLSRHPSINDLQKQERTLRALLDRVNKFGSHSPANSFISISARAATTNLSSSGKLKTYDPEVSRLNQQILKCTSTQRPGTEAYDRAAQLLQDLRSWLASSKQEGSALVLLFGAGEALAHSEHMVRSAGQVRFWSAPVVRQLVALLQVYASLVERCMAATAAAEPAARGSWLQPLTSTLVQLLVRPNFLELLVEVLELVHLDAEFEAKSQRHEAVGAAICVLDFMRELVCFAGAQIDAVNQKTLAECLLVLADLLSPSHGLLPRVLQQPLMTENMTVQLHTLFLLQQLFDSPPAVLQQLLRARPAATATATARQAHSPAADGAVAAFYLGHHLTEASRCYLAANGNPASAFAEMCKLHVRLLRSLGRGTALPPLCSLAPRVQLNNLLLSELAAEYDASQAAAAAAAAAGEAGTASPPAPDSDDEDDGPAAPKARSGCPQDGASCSDGSPPAAAAPGAAGDKASGKFEFTYDLNEDLARILELEEKLGEAVEVSGFEFDEEGRQLLKRNSVMAAASEAVGKGEGPSAGRGGLSGRASAVSEGGRPAVPKLSFSSFSRSALSSSRSLAPSAGTGRETPPTSAAPSTRVQAPPPPPPPAPVDAPFVLTAGGAAALPPTSPTSSHLQQHLGSGLHRNSPSRFSVGARSRRTSSPTAAAAARTCLSNASVHFVDDGADPDDDDGAAADGAAASFAPSPPRPSVPMLDLSALGSSGKSLGNTRRSSGATNTAGGSGGGALSANARRRHIPDSATDAGGKVGAKHAGSQARAPCAEPQEPAAAAAAVGSTGAAPGPSCGGDAAAAAACPRGSAGPSPRSGPGPAPAPLQRLVFSDPKLHVLLLGMALEVSVSAQGTLDPSYWQHYPLDNGLQYNLEYLLMWHLSSGAGAAAVGELRRKLELGGGGGGGAAAAAARLRLLRLVSRPLFDAGRYSELKFLARGAAGNVFRAKARGAAAAGPQQQVIIKSVALPASCYDRCVLPDVYSEVAIMDHYKGCPGICQLLDYGLSDESYWIVMRKYRCSLAEWRQRQAAGPGSAAAAALYLSILLQVVAALKLLARDSVVHFDLKCSNILIDPRVGVKDSELWNPLGVPPAVGGGLPPLAPAPSGSESGRRPPPPSPPFQAVLADFGEARSYRSAEEAFTVRIRGTEVYKSPEMLLMNQRLAPPPPPAAPDARPASPAAAGTAAAKAALQGAGLASDIWSLGCLAFELLSGKVLFGGDYASVTHRVAFGGSGNLALNAAERASLGDRPRLVALLEWVLARDPAKRPSLDEIDARVREVQEEIWRSTVGVGGVALAPAVVVEAAAAASSG